MTNGQGSFSFPELEAGSYTVTVNKTGFKQAAVGNIELHVADVTNVPVKMEIGSQAETITVEANAIQVETQSGAVGGAAEKSSVMRTLRGLRALGLTAASTSNGTTTVRAQ